MRFIYSILNLGVSSTDPSYVKRLKWALNVLALNSVFCVIVAVLLDTMIDGHNPNLMLLSAILVFLFVMYLNKIDKAFIGVTVLFVTSNLLLTYYSLKTGEETFTYGLFILFIIGLGLLYRDEYSKVYFFFNLSFTTICITFVILAYSMHWFDHFANPNQNPFIARQVNFYFLLFCTVVFSLVVIVSYQNHYKEMAKALDEQKVLLAEVNHRVKNNLAIIIGLLNMKKNVSNSSETYATITEIQGRIMAMALVHQQMYRKDASKSIVMDKYVNDLADGIQSSLAGEHDVNVKTEVENIYLDDNIAITLGLVLNELITNSVKHAFIEKGENEIQICLLYKKEGTLELIYRDNGVGLEVENQDLYEGMGIQLIKTLSEQLEGTCSFFNDAGLVFKMEFIP